MLKFLICALLLTYLAIAATEARPQMRKLLEDEDEELEERGELREALDEHEEQDELEERLEMREALENDKAAEEFEDRELDDDEVFGTGRAGRR